MDAIYVDALVALMVALMVVRVAGRRGGTMLEESSEVDLVRPAGRAWP